MIDIDAWFKDRGIDLKWARELVPLLKDSYPHLYEVAKNSASVEAELQIIKLVDDAQHGRLPVPSEKTAESPG